MSDRARGYLLKGKAQTALSNYGNFIDFDIKPNGAWGEYTYLYDVSFLAGIPGNKNSSHFYGVFLKLYQKTIFHCTVYGSHKVPMRHGTMKEILLLLALFLIAKTIMVFGSLIVSQKS